MKINEFIKELKTRGVIQVASIYAVTMAGAIQLFTSVAGVFGLHQKYAMAFIILVIALFPLVIFLSWKYEIVREEQVDRSKELEESLISGQKTMSIATLAKILIPVIIGLSLLIWVIVSWLKGSELDFLIDQNERTMVMNFENKTGDPTYDDYSILATNLISDGLSRTGLINIHASTLHLGDLNHSVKESRMGIFSEYSHKKNIDKVIFGSFFMVGDSVIITSQLEDYKTGTLIKSFETQKVFKDKEYVLEGLNDLCEHIIGFWLTKDNPLYNELDIRADVYEEYNKAIKLMAEDYEKALEYLDRCLEKDPKFLKAQFLKLHIYPIIYENAKFDSLLNLLESQKIDMGEKELNLFQYFKALSSRNNIAAFTHYIKEYDNAPNELFLNTSAAVLAINLKNDPNIALDILDQVDFEDLDFTNCEFCKERVKIQMESLIKKGKYEEALKFGSYIPSTPIEREIKSLEIRALVGIGNFERLDNFLNELRLLSNDDTSILAYLYSEAASYCELLGLRKKAQTYHNNVIDLFSDKGSNDSGNFYLAKSNLFIGDYDKASTEFEKILNELSSDREIYRLYYMGYYGASLAYQGNEIAAKKTIEEIAETEGVFYYGERDYCQALIWASLKEEDQTYDHLKRALLNGAEFDTYRFEFETLLYPYVHKPEFKEIISL